MPPAGGLVFETDIFHAGTMLLFKRLHIFLPQPRTRDAMAQHIDGNEILRLHPKILMQSRHLAWSAAEQHFPALTQPIADILI